MFSRWGAFVYRFRRIFVVGAVAFALAMTFFGVNASSHLSSGGWLDTTSESAAVDERLATEFGGGKSSIIALFRSTTPGANATAPAFQAAIAQTVAPLAGDPDVAGIVGYAQTKDPRFISTDSSATYVVIQLNATDEQSVDLVTGIRAKLTAPAGFSYQLTGYGPITKDAAVLSEQDLARAETVSLPIVALILILVFASLVAAAMPLLVAGLAIPTTLGLIYFVSRQIEMSVYVINIATMLGLALSIDYSLFMVSRFREELAKGRTPGEAVEKAVATSGKAVAFSGFAVAIGLSGLLLFKSSAISSIGVAGSLVVIGTLVYALTFLPATLGMLGPRVNSLSLGGLFRRLGWHPSASGGHRWEQVARVVMRRPLYVLVPVLAVLFLVGSPFFRLVQGVPDASIYPPGMESRDAYIALQTEFPTGETTPIVILATVQGDPTSTANATALASYAASLAKLDGVTRIESPYTLTDPTTGAPLTPDQVGQLYALPAASRPAPAAAAITALQAAYVRGGTVRLNAISKLDPASPQATAMVPTIRAIPAGNGITTMVGGESAIGHDFLVAQGERMPFAIGLTLIASALVLFLLFGSIAIPIKAVIMTLLSISASFGALVWIFQEGNLSNVLHFTPLPLHDRRQSDHHVQRDLRAVDGLRGAPPVADPGGLSPDRRQHRVRGRGPGPDRRGDHRRGPDHGLGVRRVRPGRHDHDQEHRGRHGDRRPARRDDHPGPARAGHDAPARPLELVGAGAAPAPGRPARLRPRRGRARGARAGRTAPRS